MQHNHDDEDCWSDWKPRVDTPNEEQRACRVCGATQIRPVRRPRRRAKRP